MTTDDTATEKARRAMSVLYNKLNTFSNLNQLKLTFRRHLTPSSELKMSRLFSAMCHFGGNELVYGEDSLSVLKKASDDVETSALTN